MNLPQLIGNNILLIKRHRTQFRIIRKHTIMFASTGNRLGKD